MCLDPVSAAVIGAVATGAGTAYNGYQQNKQQTAAVNARNAATRAELTRQHRFQDESSAQFNDALTGFDPGNQQQALQTEQATTRDAFAGNAPTAEMLGSISSAGAPRVVAEGEAATTGKAMQRNASFGDALANLAGWDQRQFGNALNLNKTGREIDLTGNLSRTSAGISGLEQQVGASNAANANAPNGLGDLLQFAGSVAGSGAFGAPGMGVGGPMKLGPKVMPTKVGAFMPGAAASNLPRIY